MMCHQTDAFISLHRLRNGIDLYEWFIEHPRFLHDGEEAYDWFIYHIRKEAREGNFSLADIDTSEDELAQLRIRGFKISARHWLCLLREGTEICRWYIGRIREVARECDIPLADIGTSEDELASFTKASS